MTGGHYLFRPYALVICDNSPGQRGMSKILTLCLQFPIITTTVGTASWQNHDSSPPQSVLYCTAMVAYVYQTPTFPPHYRDIVKVNSLRICQAIPALLRGLGEAVVTDGWCIIYSLWCTSHENLVFTPPPKKKKIIYILNPNTKYDIRWYIFQPISKYIPTHH